MEPKKDHASITVVVKDAVAKEPGITASALITRLLPVIETGAKDRRKLLSTRIGQMVRKQTLKRDGGRLYLVA